MQKIDIKTLIIALLVLINLYLLQMGFSTKTPADISNVFLKDKIESLNRDVNTVYVKLKLLDNIQVRLDNLKQEIEDLETKLTENTSR